MADKITNYQCPACTGPLHFAGGSGQLECDYCGSKFSVKEIEKLYDEKNQAAAEALKNDQADFAEGEWDVSEMASGEWSDKEKAKMKAYSCPSCGAELICDETTAATECPYCGNPNIIPGQFDGALRPDYVIPFKLSKEDAVRKLKEFTKGKLFLPSKFTKNHTIQEIKGVYVPFWLFDGEADADVTFHATRSTVHETKDETITTTMHYNCHRQGKVSFEKIPVDAASKMPDDYMDAVEPFDYSLMKEFSMAYLPGYLADKYDVDIPESSKRADRRAHASAIRSMQEDVTGYETVLLTSENIKITRGKVKYALMPVWMLSSTYQGKQLMFAVNGQNGKCVGNLPASKGKYLATLVGLTALLTPVMKWVVMLILSLL